MPKKTDLHLKDRFPEPLQIVCHPGAIKERPYELIEEFTYYTDVLDDPILVVPKGYRTDFASVPRFFWRFFPPGGKYRAAAVVHDYLCDVEPKLCDHIQATAVFNEAMQALSVPKYTRHIMAKAVRWFGPKFKPQG